MFAIWDIDGFYPQAQQRICIAVVFAVLISKVSLKWCLCLSHSYLWSPVRIWNISRLDSKVDLIKWFLRFAFAILLIKTHWFTLLYKIFWKEQLYTLWSRSLCIFFVQYLINLRFNSQIFNAVPGFWMSLYSPGCFLFFSFIYPHSTDDEIKCIQTNTVKGT